MNTQQEQQMTSLPKNLHQLVGLLAGNSMPTAVQRNSFIVNEVPREFQIAADENILANVLQSLLTTVVNTSRHSCIRVQAKEYEDIIFVSVRDNTSINDYTENPNLEKAQILARKMNGNVMIEV